jgi:hypothetical protein
MRRGRVGQPEPLGEGAYQIMVEVRLSRRVDRPKTDLM